MKMWAEVFCGRLWEEGQEARLEVKAQPPVT